MFPPSTRFLANRLGVRLQYLTFLTKYLKNTGSFYKRKSIKKGRGNRIVWIVAPALHYVQMKLKTWLEEEIQLRYSFAYVKGKKLSNAAQLLTNHALLVSLDIKHHFDSISMNQVKRALEIWGMPPAVAFLVARLSCISYRGKHFLPQGSCVSPMLANIVCEVLLDPVLAATWPQATIVRYSDNIYLGFGFSSEKVKGKDVLTKTTQVVLSATGWLTHKKRVMPQYRKQGGLGFVLNTKPNMPAPKYDGLKATLYNLTTKDLGEQLNKYNQLTGASIESLPKLISILESRINYWAEYIALSKTKKLRRLLCKIKERVET